MPAFLVRYGGNHEGKEVLTGGSLPLCAVLCWAGLGWAGLCWATLPCPALHCTALHCIALLRAHLTTDCIAVTLELPH